MVKPRLYRSIAIILIIFVCISTAASAGSVKSGTSSLSTQETEITSVISKLSASVVGIIGKLKQSSESYNSYSDNLVFGSGVIYKANGFIVTNAHVVADMDTIVVVLSTGKAYEARLKAIDEPSDLALIKIDKGMLTPAKFGNAKDIEVGKSVIAIGTPLSFSLRNSATKGMISGLNRSADGEYKFIQSDAAINGGNSGGPLVDLNGKVIGINTVKYVGYGVEGLSFSIPVDTVKYVLSQFERFGKVRRPYLGAVFMEGVAARYGLPSSEGLTISEIKKDSPAQKAGLSVDDVLISVNGDNITTKIDFNEAMKNYLPGNTVTLGIERNGKVMKIKVTFGESK
jgi:Trypsin-like serine proteases, typically periplasmic, contain C-terminal PDZ domain